MNRKIEISVLMISQVRNYDDFYHLLMEDMQEHRKFSITIGRSEAEAIALGLESVPVPRPLTHDIFKNLLQVLDLRMTEVIIHKLDEENMIFYAYIYLQDKLNILELDARPSDAIALAIRCGIPIYAFEDIIVKATRHIPSIKTNPEGKDLPLSKLSLATLNEKLKEAVEKEMYEDAVKLRDEIQTRQKTAKS